MNDKSLNDIGSFHNTDKASTPRVENGKGHDYLRKYEFFFKKIKNNKSNIKFLELGIGPDWNMGASANTWLEYFDENGFELIIADNKQSSKKFIDPRTSIYVGDLGDDKFISQFKKDKYDIIIDDASHLWSHQINCFLQLFNCVNEGGIYIIEDIHTSFGKLREKYNDNKEDTYSFLVNLSGSLVGSGKHHNTIKERRPFSKYKNHVEQIDSICFIEHSCIICKKNFF